jgi:hypothetical protein
MTEEKGMKEDRIFTNINLKGSRGPPTKGLYGGRRNASFCKRSRTTRSEWVTSIVFWEKTTKSWNEPMSGGDSALRSEPEFRMDGEKLIAWVEICEKGRVRVRGAIVFLNDDGIAFKSDIAFVGGEEEGEEARFKYGYLTLDIHG